MKKFSWFPTDLAQECQELRAKKCWADKRYNHDRRGSQLTAFSLFLNSSVTLGTPRRGTENFVQEEAKEID